VPAHHPCIKRLSGGTPACPHCRGRNFLELTGSAAAAALSGASQRLLTRRWVRRQVRPRDQGRRRARSQPIAARQARHRHPLGNDRGDRAGDSRRPRVEDHRRVRQAGDAGLIDLHCHVYPYGSAIGIPADELVQHQCTTTVVSAGDAGVNNLAALRRYIVAQSRSRIYAFVHIANNGLSVSRGGALQHRQRADGSLRHGAGGKSGFPDRRQGADVGERDLQARSGAAEARDPGLRDVRLAGPR